MQLSVPTGEVISIGVPSFDNQTNDVQIAGGGRKSLSVVPNRKQLFVSRLTPETTSADVLEFIQQEFPSQNITVEGFKFPYVRRISSFKISAPPEVFNVLNSKSFRLNDELVIKEFVPNRRRTNNRPSTTVPAPKN